MKYLFGTDLSYSGKNETPDGMQYLREELPEPMAKELRKKGEALEKEEEGYKLPVWVSALALTILLVGIIAAAVILRARTPVEEGYQNAQYGFWFGGACFLLGGLLVLAERLRKARREKSPRLNEARRAFDSAQKSADAYLGVPGGAIPADVLAFSYTREGGDFAIKGSALNLEVRFFTRDGDLCLTDGEQVYSVPMSSLTGLSLVEKGIPMMLWNKKDGPAGEKYSSAGVMTGRYGLEGLRFCCALEWMDAGESYRLLFPAYELPTLGNLTGLRWPQLPAPGAPAPRERPSASPEDKKVRPVFYWKFPKEELAFLFTPQSDTVFKAEHPKLYVVLMVFALLALLVPFSGFPMLELFVLGESWWIMLGFAGGLIMGIGLMNIVAAWLHQYLGHYFTIACVLIGGAMMAASWFLML